MDTIQLTVPLKAEYFSSVRLFVSGLLMSHQVDYDTIEDVKTAVSESLNIALKCHCAHTSTLSIDVDDNQMKLSISGFGQQSEKETEDIQMAKTIISCLVDATINNDTLLMTVNL
ncbi:anti-sigma factor [Peptoniphilus equinus]|uniref:Anti-sigma factor n=1 Tax=Peptoniphilus equinus TaxID=3016343 RepID=A0ABY7QVQ1_9FIRM|nr:anti-sigma factor [Peptoniphilus equinus]WBW49993.1 anti-sigma factor [Peptoniphilus equinus]